MPADLFKTYKKRQEKFCEPSRVLRSVTHSGSFKIDTGTCWICWVRLTGKDLGDWRTRFSSLGAHPKKCPVCGYSQWKGRIWYPFRFLGLQQIPDPSLRMPAKRDH